MTENFSQRQGPSDNIEKICTSLDEISATIDSLTDVDFPVGISIVNASKSESAYFHLNQRSQIGTAKFHMRTNAKDKTGPWEVTIEKKKKDTMP